VPYRREVTGSVLHVVDHHDALFSVNRSLLGMVTPNLRAVAYLLTDTELRVRFMYEDEPDEWTTEAVSVAETECIADGWPTREVSYIAEHVPLPQHLVFMPQEHVVFFRYEPRDDSA
jgi:hypothetical protein